MRSVGNDPIAGAKAVHVRARFDHRPCVGITQRQRLIELVKSRFEYRTDSVGTQAIEQQAYSLGLLQRLADESCPAELQQHPFRARGEQRTARAD